MTECDKPVSKKIVIIIPTYNEFKNIPQLIKRVENAGNDQFEILFVDDASPDGTGDLIEKFTASKKNISAIHRKKKLGLGSAYIEGIKLAIARGYDYIFEMDADLSHNPENITLMIEKFDNYDIVIGSRFWGKLSNINSTPFRILASLAIASYIRIGLRLKCWDVMAGFIGYKREVLEALDWDHFISKGYSFQAEIKYECQKKGFKSIEVPIVFNHRMLGESKITFEIICEAFLFPIRLAIKKCFE